MFNLPSTLRELATEVGGPAASSTSSERCSDCGMPIFRLRGDRGAIKAPVTGVPVVALTLVTWQTNFEGRGGGFAMSDMAQFVSSLNLSRFAGRLRVERDPITRSSLLRLLIEEANNLAFNLGQLGSLQSEVIEGRARIAIQIALIKTLAANGQDARLVEGMLRNLIEVQKTIEQCRQAIVDATNRNHDTRTATSMNRATKMAMA